VTEIKSSKAGGPTAAKRQGGNKILGPLPPEMSMICARPRPPPISCRGCSETPMRLITYDGRTQNLRAWAREIGIGWCALQQRLAKGWPVEQPLAAGKRELYKGKPALAPLARKAGVSARAATYRRAVGHPMEKVLQPGVLPHPPQHPLTFNGQTKSITAWADELGISHSALSNRLSRGWPLERTLSWRRKPKE
jgi:hypothetical protein